MKRSNSYGRMSLSTKNIGLLTILIPQTIMVVHQSHLFLHTICTSYGRGVRSFAIPNRLLFCSFITSARSILLIGTELTPPFNFTPHDCYIWQIYQGVALSLILIAVDTILILRGESNKAIYSLAFLFLLQISLCALSWQCRCAMGSVVLFSY